MSYDCDNERMEALCAGERARSCLVNALDALDSAKNWGFFDLLGGGIISTLAKHSKMDKASGYIEEAKAALRVFGRELGDIEEYENIDLSTEDFWGFADWFFDGLLSDWVMQDRISEARAQVQRAIDRVDSVLDGLKR